VGLGQRRRHHALADRFEDLRFAEIRNQQAERQASDRCRDLYEGAGAGPALDQPGRLEIADRPPDRDTRRAEQPAEIRFARQTVAIGQPAGLNIAAQGGVDLLVLTGWGKRLGTQVQMIYQL
jgi:hypothetical protein